MKKGIQTVLMYMIFAAGLGSIIYTAALLASVGMTEESRGLLVWVAASGIIGVISMIYEAEALNHLQATLIHAPLTFLTALVAGSIMGYGEGSVTLLLMRMLPVIVIIYVLVHLLMYFLRRQSVKSVNDKLAKK